MLVIIGIQSAHLRVDVIIMGEVLIIEHQQHTFYFLKSIPFIYSYPT